MTEKILACPFCGSDETTSFYFFGEPMVGCGSCNAHGPEAHTFDRAIELWNAAANQLEQLRNGIDEALREAPDENSYSVYLELVTHFRGEIEKLRADLAESQEQLRMTLVSYNATHATLQLEIDKLRNERDAIARDYDNERNAATIMRAELNEQLKIATNLGSKRWKALNEIYIGAEKRTTNWCRRKAAEGLGLRGAE